MILRVLYVIFMSPLALLHFCVGVVGMAWSVILSPLMILERGRKRYEHSLAWKFGHNMFVSSDLSFNASVGGDPRETASGHWGRSLRDRETVAALRMMMRLGCFLLSIAERGHCKVYASVKGAFIDGLLTFKRLREDWRRKRAAGS